MKTTGNSRRIEETFADASAKHRQGDFDAAIAGYRKVLTIAPRHASALHFLGVALHQRGELEAAAELMRQSIAIEPNIAAFHGNLGNLYKDLKRPQAALACYEEILKRDPRNALAHLEAGKLRFDLGAPEVAVASLREAAASAGNSPQVLFAIAEALHERHQLDGAMALFHRVVTSDPLNAEAFNRLGGILAELGRNGDAIQCLNQAVALRPDLTAARNNLGIALTQARRFADAEAIFREIIRLAPDYAKAYCNLGNVLRHIGCIDEAIATFAQAIRRDPRYAKAHHNLLFTLNSSTRLTRTELFEKHLDFGRVFDGPVEARDGARRPSETDRKLRIGYVSGDLKMHPVGYFMEAILEHHDNDRFAIVCYHNSPVQDALSRSLARLAAEWIDCSSLGDDEFAARIRRDRIDILVDLSGHTENNRLLVFARRPAPIQMTYLGYANTTGMRSVDYRITDWHADPEGHEKINSETLIRLENSYYCYRPRPDAPPVAALPALDNGFVTFGCCLNYAKASDASLDLWAAVLAAIDGSRLCLRASSFSDPAVAKAALGRLIARGIDSSRIELLPHAPFPSHLETYARIDVVLDTYPFNLATNSVEALWQGVPFVSLAGDTSPSRMGRSILSAAGLADLAVDSQADYVARCRLLAGDTPALATLRESLRARLRQSPLLDGGAKARQLEAAYRAAWQALCPNGHGSG